jgi:hypothetical protein
MSFCVRVLSFITPLHCITQTEEPFSFSFKIEKEGQINSVSSVEGLIADMMASLGATVIGIRNF